MLLFTKNTLSLLTVMLCYVQYGALEVTNHKTRHKAVLNFKPCGWFGKDLNKTVGYVYDERSVIH